MKHSTFTSDRKLPASSFQASKGEGPVRWSHQAWEPRQGLVFGLGEKPLAGLVAGLTPQRKGRETERSLVWSTPGLQWLESCQNHQAFCWQSPWIPWSFHGKTHRVCRVLVFNIEREAPKDLILHLEKSTTGCGKDSFRFQDVESRNAYTLGPSEIKTDSHLIHPQSITMVIKPSVWDSIWPDLFFGFCHTAAAPPWKLIHGPCVSRASTQNTSWGWIGPWKLPQTNPASSHHAETRR